MLSVLRFALHFAHEALKSLVKSGFTLEEKLLRLFFFRQGIFVFYVLIANASFVCKKTNKKTPSYHFIPGIK